MIHGQGEKETQIPDGGARESNKGRGRFDLLPYEALEAWAIWSEQGAVKYGDRNWEKGLLVSDCINRLVRHASKAANGWTDEDHLAACMWNAAGAITMMKRRPDLNDHPWQAPPKGEKTVACGRDIDFWQLGDESHASPRDKHLEFDKYMEFLQTQKNSKKHDDKIDSFVYGLDHLNKNTKTETPRDITYTWSTFVNIIQTVATLSEDDRYFLLKGLTVEGFSRHSLLEWLENRRPMLEELRSELIAKYEGKVEEECRAWTLGEIYELADKSGSYLKFNSETDSLIFNDGTEFIRIGLEDAWAIVGTKKD
jgi:hypothetical protein